MKDFRLRLYATRIGRLLAWAQALLLAGALGGFPVKVQAQDQSAPDEPDFIVPSRPTVSNPAEFQKPGVLQLEVGYNANFQAPGIHLQQDMPLALRFAVNRRLLLEFDGDSPSSQTVAGVRTTGAGDSQLGIQIVLQHEKESRPGFSVAYYIKLPTADRAQGLGTGRVDHNFIALLSKKIGGTTLDFNVTFLFSGRTTDNGHASSGQAALAASHNVTGTRRNSGRDQRLFPKRCTVRRDVGARGSDLPDQPQISVRQWITLRPHT